MSFKNFTTKEVKSLFRVLEDHIARADTPFQKKKAVRDEALFKCLYFLALRVSEGLALRKNDYNSSTHEMHCVRSKNGINNTIQLYKEGFHTMEALKNHLDFNNPQDYIFTNFTTDQPLSRKTADKLIKKYCIEAGIKDHNKIHNHTLRHTRAIVLLEETGDIYFVQWYLGHKSINNTMVYLEFTSKQKAKIFAKLKKSGK